MPAQGSAQVLSLVVFGTVATWYLVPWLKTRGRVDALESGKSPAYAYRFVDHARYLDAWFEALHLTSNVTLVVHDWGSALGFHRTTRYPEQIKAIAYMEAITMPLRWEDCGEARGIFQALRSPQGELATVPSTSPLRADASVSALAVSTPSRHSNRVCNVSPLACVSIPGGKKWRSPVFRMIFRSNRSRAMRSGA
jgi:pimeloyl-ACP methyl ester carboxylesterase